MKLLWGKGRGCSWIHNFKPTLPTLSLADSMQIDSRNGNIFCAIQAMPKSRWATWPAKGHCGIPWVHSKGQLRRTHNFKTTFSHTFGQANPTQTKSRLGTTYMAGGGGGQLHKRFALVCTQWTENDVSKK